MKKETEATESAKMTAEEKARDMRAKRDWLLRRSDKYMIADFPIADSERAEVETYRTALRELPEQDGFPDIKFPSAPSFMDESDKFADGE